MDGDAAMTVVVTGVGVCTPLGLGLDVNWRRLMASEAAHGCTDADLPQARYPLPPATAAHATRAPDLRWPKYAKYAGRAVTCGLHAIAEAARRAGLGDRGFDPYRIAVHAATGQTGLDVEEFFPALSAAWLAPEGGAYDDLGGRPSRLIDPHFSLRTLSNTLVSLASNELGARGPSANYVQGELATAHAIRAAGHDLLEGRADVAIVAACDSLVGPSPWLAYQRKGLLARSWSAGAGGPFDAARCGVLPGEGGAALVLERGDDHGSRRGELLTRVAGVHLISPPPSDVVSGSSRTWRDAPAAPDLDGAPPPTVVVARGLGTVEHDRREAEALRREMGDGVVVTAFKGATAYLGAASPLVDVALAVRALETGVVPPVVRLAAVGEGCVLPFARRPVALPGTRVRALVSSAGWDEARANVALERGLH